MLTSSKELSRDFKRFLSDNFKMLADRPDRVPTAWGRTSRRGRRKPSGPRRWPTRETRRDRRMRSKDRLEMKEPCDHWPLSAPFETWKASKCWLHEIPDDLLESCLFNIKELFKLQLKIHESYITIVKSNGSYSSYGGELVVLSKTKDIVWATKPKKINQTDTFVISVFSALKSRNLCAT